MKSVTIQIYKFSELSEQAKEKALRNMADINTDFQWWDYEYEDAKNIGLKITSFDLDRRECEAQFIYDADHAAYKILEEHGETCGTYKAAKTYLASWNELVTKYSDGINTDVVTYENGWEFDQAANELADEFLKELQEEYLILLRSDFEYQTSNEAIIETIEANDYDFTEDGELY